jgi:hypothetical protein
MPFEHIIDHRNHSVVVRGTGEGSIDETAHSVQCLLEDKSIGTDYTFMFVVDDIALQPTPEQVWIIASFLDRILSRFSGRMAIVTSQLGQVTAAHLIAIAADKMGGRVRVFLSEHQARQWLVETTFT